MTIQLKKTSTGTVRATFPNGRTVYVSGSAIAETARNYAAAFGARLVWEV